jgi:hypothetical protein
VVGALWADGRWLRAAELRGSGATYHSGRIDAGSLREFVCEFEATGLWSYEEVRSAGLGPFEGLSIRWKGKRKEWTCPLDPPFSDCGFSEFTDVRKALLATNPGKTAKLDWNGLASPSWGTGTGEPPGPAPCPLVLDPAAVKGRLMPGNERQVLASLWDRPGLWSAFLDGIASAEDIWLDLAHRLHPASDAGSAEDMGMAIGQAFLQAPEKVLARFGAQAACYTLGFDESVEDTAQGLKILIQQRRAVAMGIKSPDLAKEREACLAEIDKLEADIARADR